jgi:acyl-CoA thioesterase FadM
VAPFILYSIQHRNRAICATGDFTVLWLDPMARKSRPFLAEVALRATELKLPPPKL